MYLAQAMHQRVQIILLQKAPCHFHTPCWDIDVEYTWNSQEHARHGIKFPGNGTNEQHKNKWPWILMVCLKGKVWWNPSKTKHKVIHSSFVDDDWNPLVHPFAGDDRILDAQHQVVCCFHHQHRCQVLKSHRPKLGVEKIIFSDFQKEDVWCIYDTSSCGCFQT